MNTQFLNYAIEIERAGSITKAAQKLYMAQPNLSKVIKELEDSLGYEIFERTANGIIPTEKGSHFLVYARNILDQLRKIEEIKYSDSVGCQRFYLSIPRGSYIADSCANFVAGLNKKQGMEVVIQETNSMQAINNVAYERFNLGIIRYQNIYEKYFLEYIKSKQLISQLVWKFEYLVLMSKKHPLAERKTVKAESLSGYIELSHADLMIPYIEMPIKEEKEKQEGKHIYVYDRGCQFDLLTMVPTTYMWVSPLPDSYLQKYELVQRKCVIPNNCYKDVLIRREEYEPGGMDEQFQEMLYRSRDQVADKEYV